MASTQTPADTTAGSQSSSGLLPAFESMKAKPALHSTLLNHAPSKPEIDESTLLPTPLPTSEAVQPPSSPAPFLASTPPPSSPIRSHFTPSAIFDHAPLSPHYKVRIPSNGEPVLVGRSSKSCAVSLRANNKQISRVHLRIWFDTVESIVSAECLGWNGFSVQVDNEKYEVSKGQIINFDLTSDTFLTVCDERVEVEVEYVPNAKRAKHAEPAVPQESKEEEKVETVSKPATEIVASNPVVSAVPVTPAAPAESTTPATPAPVIPSIDVSSEKRHISDAETKELSNMICNMVAFTHLRTLPFKDIHRANSRLSALTKQQLTLLLRGIECVGEVKYFDDSKRAAFEYYYMPEKDADAVRRATVQSAHGRRSLRSCRKTPKQYLYKPLNLD